MIESSFTPMSPILCQRSIKPQGINQQSIVPQNANQPCYRPTLDAKTGKVIYVASDDPTDTICVSDPGAGFVRKQERLSSYR